MLNRFLRQIDLILRSDVRLADITRLTLRATQGQRRVESFIELLISAHRPRSVLAVVSSGLATGLRGLSLRASTHFGTPWKLGSSRE